MTIPEFLVFLKSGETKGASPLHRYRDENTVSVAEVRLHPNGKDLMFPVAKIDSSHKEDLEKVAKFTKEHESAGRLIGCAIYNSGWAVEIAYEIIKVS